MDVDFELILSITPERADVLGHNLSSTLELRKFKRKAGCGIRWRKGAATEGSIDAVTADFIRVVKDVVSADDVKCAELRVGVFVTHDEAASMTALLSATTIQALAELGLAMEISFYPCAAD